ncbi:hypothetical protein B0H19DRAFT_1080328 [Mycena capillaripes]|nr:hypothetical protein B0H19DRAFT_1080328 [Mycena capillaripes]
MSSFNILGFFQLKAGRGVIINKPNSAYATHYAHYSTHVWCTNGTVNTTITADMRVYVPSTAPLLDDGMVAFTVCTVQSTAVPPATNSLPSNTLTLDALTFIVLPGSPDSDTYNNQMNSHQCPQTLDDGHGSRAVTVAVLDFVRGETKASTVQCVFDFSTARWTRALSPHANTTIQFYGLCRELSPTGILRVKINAAAFNISSNASAPSDDTSESTGSTTSAPVIPSKRRKFDPPSPPSVNGSNSPSAPSISRPSSNIIASVTPAPDPGAVVSLFLPQQGLYNMPGYSTFQPPFSPYLPYNSRGEYIPSASLDSRPTAATQQSDSANISSAPVGSTSTVPLPNNPTFNRSAANPYSYPMTQIPPTANSTT